MWIEPWIESRWIELNWSSINLLGLLLLLELNQSTRTNVVQFEVNIAILI